MLGIASKSITMGAQITGHALGTIIALPGRLMDAAIEFALISNFDAGVIDVYPGAFEKFLHRAGFIPGAFIGGALGTLVALIVLLPDSLSRLLAFSYLKLSNFIDNIAIKIRVFDAGTAVDSNFLDKAWSIGKLALGVPIGYITSVIGYVIDLGTQIFGLQTKLSHLTYKFGFVIAGFVGSCIAVVISLPLKLIDQVGRAIANGYFSFRDKVRNLYAFGYAKLNVEPIEDANDMGTTLHSNEFITAVHRFKFESTANILRQMIYPVVNKPNVLAANDAPPQDPSMPDCPIDYVPIHEPIVDKYGHIYEESALLRWRKNNKTSPMTRGIVEDNELYPKDILKAFFERKRKGKAIPAVVNALLEKSEVKRAFKL